jgi:DNA modification methylase
MIESVRGFCEPVRIAPWVKPESRTKVKTVGWNWASVSVIAMRKGPKNDPALTNSPLLDWIEAPPVTSGRRAELPKEVAQWAVSPFCKKKGIFVDPFAGSGQLPIVAANAGMEAYGFEINP